jgi:hypothetical protein
MSTRKTQLLKRIAGKKGRSTALTEEEKALRDIGDAIEKGAIGGGSGYDLVIIYEPDVGTRIIKGSYQDFVDKMSQGIIPTVGVFKASISDWQNKYKNVYPKFISNMTLESNNDTIYIYFYDDNWRDYDNCITVHPSNTAEYSYIG